MVLTGDSGGDFVSGPSGQYVVDGAGSVLELYNNVSVTGGTWSNTNGGVLRVRPGQTGNLTSPTLTGTSTFVVEATAAVGSTLNIRNSWTGGTLELRSTNPGGNTPVLNVASPTTFGGNMTLLGTYAGTGNGPRIDGGTNTITIASGSIVRGVTYFNNTTVINNGLFDANNVAGMYLDANNSGPGGQWTNNATMRASGGGLLVLTGDFGGDYVSGPSAVYLSDGAGSIFELYNNAAVTGGTWTSTNGGLLRVRPGTTGNLITPTISNGSTFVVPATASGAATLNITTSITGPGTLELRSTNPGGNTAVLNIANNVTLGGGVTIWGSYGTTGNGTRIDGGANMLTIASGATIRGVVAFNNVKVTNNGTINADNHVVPSALGNADMYIDPNNSAGGPWFVNNGTLSATNGAYVYLTGDFGGTFGGTGPITVTGTSQIVTWNSAAGDMGPISGTGTFIAAGSANVGFQSFRMSTLQATNSGVARVTTGATPGLSAGTSKVSTITLTNSGRVDLTNNGIVITGMTQAAVRPLIAAGRNGGQWNGGNGIGSSLANNNGKAIGYVVGSDIAAAPGTFLGQSFVLTDVLARYTWAGDCNLDGIVNFTDLLLLASNYGVTGTGTWYKGDYDYDGNVNFNDLLGLAANYNQPLTGSFEGDWAMAQSMAVPEPTVLGSAVALGAVMLRRRRAR
ncbi:MAG: hypothetical protein QM770_08945 [Tepidisphaeraceae bacterium]